MANPFAFQMGESFLRSYADYIKQLREQNPGKNYMVSLNIELVPDGVGYEVVQPPQIIVEEVPEQEKAKQ